MIEARVNGTLSATGVLAPTLTTRAQFKLGESVYDNLPLTGEGTVQVAGTRTSAEPRRICRLRATTSI